MYIQAVLGNYVCNNPDVVYALCNHADCSWNTKYQKCCLPGIDWDSGRNVCKPTTQNCNSGCNYPITDYHFWTTAACINPDIYPPSLQEVCCTDPRLVGLAYFDYARTF